MTRRSTLAALAAALVALALASGAPPAAAQATGEEDVFVLNFHEIELPKLAKIISNITGKRIVFDEKVRQKLSIFSADEVTADEAFELFQAALAEGGQYTLTPIGPGHLESYKIVLRRDVKSLAGQPIAEPVPQGSGVVTYLIQMTYIDASEMAKVFQQLVSRDASVIAYPPSNTIIVTDLAPNVRRLLEIVDRVDVQESEQVIEVIPLEHAAAADIAEKVAQILSQEDTGTATSPTVRTAAQRARTAGSKPGAQAAAGLDIGPGSSAKILPYERTNSLIVVASKPEVRKVRELAEKLDFEAPPGRSKFHIYPLQNARAGELVEVLDQLLSGSSGLPASRRQSQQRTSRTTQRTAAGRTTGATASSDDTVGQFVGEVAITADPSTNSLLISAAPEDYRTLRPVIARLDARRKQVYVEAVILEVTIDDSESIGVQASTVVGDGDAASIIQTTVGEKPDQRCPRQPPHQLPPRLRGRHHLVEHRRVRERRRHRGADPHRLRPRPGPRPDHRRPTCSPRPTSSPPTTRRRRSWWARTSRSPPAPSSAIRASTRSRPWSARTWA